MEALGRFEILDPLGAGGMGSVYRAFDPKLERHVALKVVGGSGTLAPGTTLQLRHVSTEHTPKTKVLPHRVSDDLVADVVLLDEARAMAKLSHPNVVSVYEVGSDGERLFIAMELVEGKNMREWLEEEPTPAEVVSAFQQAARGLAAAHECGLVHRDFKPDNVLIGGDGVVRVADFGLALSETPSSPLGQNVVGGTSAYMAPELKKGGAATPASDVYAFCVALVEALSGSPPPPDKGIDSILTSLGRVPKNLRPAVRRGLDTDPANRPADGRELAVLLSPRRRLALPVLVAGIATAAIAFGVTFALTSAEERSPCTGWPELEAIWDESSAASLEARIRAIGGNLAADTAPRVAENMSQRARRLRALREQSCEAQRTGEISKPVLLGRNECLDADLAAFETVVSFVRAVRDEDELVSLVDLSRPAAASRCTQADAPTAGADSPARLEIRRELAAIETAVKGRRQKRSETVESVSALLERTKALGNNALTAKVTYALGRAKAAAKKYDEAVELLSRVATLAESTDDRLAAFATIRRARIVGLSKNEPKHADAILSLAEPVLKHYPEDYQFHGFFHQTRGLLASRQFRFEDQLAALERETAALELAAEPSLRARRSRALARIAELRDDLDAAMRDYEDLVAHQRQAFGSHHPKVAAALRDAARVMRRAGNYEDSVKYLDEAVRIYEAADLTRMALQSKHMKAFTLRKTDPTASVKFIEETLARDRPNDKLLLARFKYELGSALVSLGNYDRAEKLFDETDAVALRLTKNDAERINTSEIRIELALNRGEFRVAEKLAVARLARRRSSRPRTWMVVSALEDLANARIASGDAKGALSLFEEAVTLCRESETSIQRLCAIVEAQAATAMNENGDPRAALALTERLSGDFPEPKGAGIQLRFERARASFLLGDKGALEEATKMRDEQAENKRSMWRARRMTAWIQSVGGR